MNAFTRSISQIFKGAAKAFQTFPATIASALAFAIVTMIRIQLDWPQESGFTLLFDSLQWALALGAIFSLATMTAAQSRLNTAKSFLAANLAGIAAAVVTFLALYLPGGTVSGLDMSRVGAALLVSFLAFIILAGFPKDQSDFSQSFFMAHKAFFIAMLYGMVIMGGTSGVAFAIQALIYKGMSAKVYGYIATLSGFLAFTMFVGYFPDFRKDQVDEHREVAQKQPRFIEILFGYIMIPIVLALTAVLLLWAIRTIVTGSWPMFTQLAGIAAGYTAGGIWLHIMVTHYEAALAKFYRRIYPVAALVILAFEAWALVNQLNKSGMKMTEYSFIVIWIIAVAAAVLLLTIKAKAHPVIAALASAMAIISVLPVLGYQALPVTAQVSRLENLLAGSGILVGDQLTPALTAPDQAVREQITDAVNFLAYAQDAKLPAWFDKHLGENDTFRAKLGFDQQWPDSSAGTGYASSSVVMPREAVDISGYRWAIHSIAETYNGSGLSQAVSVKGERGTYAVTWYPR